MEEQQGSFESAPGETRDTAAPSHPKKSYETPELQIWGSIVDMTQGLKLGLEDMPIKGGTRVV